MISAPKQYLHKQQSLTDHNFYKLYKQNLESHKHRAEVCLIRIPKWIAIDRGRRLYKK